MTDVLAECAAVVRRFGAHVAVDQVDLRVGPGEVVGLLGANGAGKTTLIRILLGLLRPSAGRVLLFGTPPSRQVRRRVGYVPQGLGLYDDLTPAENLAFAQAAFSKPRREVPAELRPFSGTVVAELPLGVQRRVAFAQALAHEPALLVLDEPTSGVDPLARARLWQTIRDAADAGAGVLVTTHYMDEAEECDRLVVMAGGRVVAAGTPAEIVGTATVTAVETASWADAYAAIEARGLPVALAGTTLRVPGAGSAAVSAALRHAGVESTVSEVPATLDERFFELTAPPRRGAVAGAGDPQMESEAPG
jgi:ABC-2 type transport system ATP-binding protein/ribosome-dependent ATPase